MRTANDIAQEIDWAVGDVVGGRFTVKGLIGKGGMGTVYRVRHRDWNVDLAVKVPLPELVAEGLSRERFIREAHTWVNLGVHPNIVQCWFVREIQGIPLLFLDYLAGGSLREWNKSGRVKPGQWDRILDLCIQACDGLAHAHSLGVTHRDVKPANLLLRGENQLCVTDFGLVKIGSRGETVLPGAPTDVTFLDLEPEDVADGVSLECSAAVEGGTSPSPWTLTASGSMIGTPEYGAPEQWGEASHVGPAADIYALGIILFEMCCGRRPFDDGKKRLPAALLVGRHICKQAPDPREFHPQVPEELALLIGRCLEKEPQDRPASMLELRRELVEIYLDLAATPYHRPVPSAGVQRADALNNKAVSLWNLGKNQEAFSAWREASKLDALHPETVYNRSVIKWRLGQADAEYVRQRLAQLKTAYPRAGTYLGHFYLEGCLPEQAERELAAAVALPEASGDGGAWRALGVARMHLERFDEAESAFVRALKLLPDDSEMAAYLEMAREQSRTREGRILFPRSKCVIERHTQGTISALTFSPNGRSMFCAARGRVERLSLPGGRLEWSAEAEPGVHGLVCTPDGGRLLSLGNDHGRFYSVLDGTPLGQVKPDERILGMTPDGKNMLVAGENLELLKMASGERLVTYAGHTGPVTSVAVCGDGSFLLSGSRDGTARLWDLESGTCLSVLTGHTAPVDAVALTPDGSIGLSGDRRGGLRAWMMSTGDCIHELTARGRVLTIKPAGDGRMVLLESIDPSTQRGFEWWDLATGEQVLSQPGGPSVLTPDGAYALSAAPAGPPWRLQLWELAGGRVVRSLAGHDEQVSALAVGPKGRFALSGSRGGSIRLWELDEESRVYERAMMVRRARSHTESMRTLESFKEHLDRAEKHLLAGELSQAYRELVQARAVPGYSRDPITLRLNALLADRLRRTGVRAIWELRTIHTDSNSPWQAVDITPDGQTGVLAAGKSPRIWELASGSCLRGFIGHSEEVRALTLAREGTLITAGQDGTLRRWDLETGDCEVTLAKLSYAVHCLSATRDGRRFLIGGPRLPVSVWLEGSYRPVCSLAVEASHATLSPDGRWALIAGAADSSLSLWDIDRTRCVLRAGDFRSSDDQPLPSEATRATAVAMADLGFAVTAGLDHVLRVWDLRHGKCVQELHGHSAEATCLVLSGSGHYLLSASSQGTLRLWSVLSGQCLGQVEGHAGRVTDVAWTPDGRFALSAGTDGALKAWEFDWELDTVEELRSLADTFRPESLLGRLGSLFRRGP